MQQVSLVLNIHDESRFLVRTLVSLEHAVRFARRLGIESELILVMDRPDAATERLARAYDYSAFGEARLLKVDNGSLGPSRNDGVRAAGGRYVWLCDGDDLVSYNALAEMHRVAEQSAVPSIVYPEYLLSFGDSYFLTRYFGTDEVPELDFVASHPFVSRSFARRETFEQTPFADLRVSRGFAYEDWHFNASVYAKGYECVVARQTILFYRQRQGSLLRAANAISARQIPHSPLFEPGVYLDRTARASAAGGGSPTAADIASPQVAPLRTLMDDEVCLETIWAAARIDPAIDLTAIQRGGQYANVCNPREPARVYRALCELVNGGRYTDVLLLPWLTAGGGEKYMIGVVRALAALDASVRCLVVVAERGGAHQWLEHFPAGTVFVDLPAIAAGLAPEDQRLVLLRLLLACAPRARLHLKPGGFGQAFFERFRDCLGGLRTYYYRFSEPLLPVAGRLYPLGAEFEFVSSNLDRLAGVVSDNREVIARARRRFGLPLDEWHCVYAPCDVETRPAVPRFRGSGAPWRRRLLWASRLAPEKRPALLPALARRLAEECPDLRIEVYGHRLEWAFDPSEFEGMANIAYHGGFDSLDQIPVSECDALVYTSLYDGIPNILLKMMARGVPVIAPAVGGIPELVVDGATGILVPNLSDDEEMVERYVVAVRRLYQDPDAATAMTRGALDLLRRRHGAEAFSRRVAEVFMDQEPGNG